MDSGTLHTFIDKTHTAFGPLTTDMVAAVRAELERLARAPSSEPWLRALHEEVPASKELYRAGTHGFVLLAHSEPVDSYRAPHDHRFTERDLKAEQEAQRITRYVAGDGFWTAGR